MERIVLMMVAGCGKSPVGAVLAPMIGAELIDGYDLPPAAKIAKLHRTEPLSDADRRPWLAQLWRSRGRLSAVLPSNAAIAHRLRVLPVGLFALSILSAAKL